MDNDQVLFAKAPADETRQEIMLHLCCVWLSVNDVVDKLGGKVNQPTVLKKLEDAGLVFVRQEGRQRFYTLNQERMTVCCGMLVRQFAPDYAAKVVCATNVAYLRVIKFGNQMVALQWTPIQDTCPPRQVDFSDALIWVKGL